jgi:hypothetical protein
LTAFASRAAGPREPFRGACLVEYFLQRRAITGWLLRTSGYCNGLILIGAAGNALGLIEIGEFPSEQPDVQDLQLLGLLHQSEQLF